MPDPINDPNLASELDSLASTPSPVEDPNLASELDSLASPKPTVNPVSAARDELKSRLKEFRMLPAFTSAATSAWDKELVKENGVWKTPMLGITADKDAGYLEKLGLSMSSIVQGGLSKFFGAQTGSLDSEIKRLQQVHGLDDSQMQSAWSDLVNEYRTWEPDEKTRVLSDGTISLNPASRELLDTPAIEKIIDASKAPDASKAAAKQNLPNLQTNAAQAKLEGYEAAISALKSPGGRAALIPFGGAGIILPMTALSPTEYAAKKGRKDITTTAFMRDYERDVVGKNNPIMDFARGIATDWILGANNVAVQTLGNAGMLGSEKAGAVAAEGQEAATAITAGKPDTRLTGQVVQQALPIGAMMVATQLTGAAAALTGSEKVLGVVNSLSPVIYSGAQSAGAQYAQSRAEGKDHTAAQADAAKAGATTALITGMFSAAGMGGVEDVAAGKQLAGVTLGDLIKSRGREEVVKNAKSFAGKLAKGFMEEAPEEWSDQLVSAFVNADPKTNLSDAWQQAWDAGMVGGIMGAGTAAFTGNPEAAKTAIEIAPDLPDTAKALVEVTNVPKPFTVSDIPKVESTTPPLASTNAPETPTEKVVPERVPEAGNVPTPSGSGVATPEPVAAMPESTGTAPAEAAVTPTPEPVVPESAGTEIPLAAETPQPQTPTPQTDGQNERQRQGQGRQELLTPATEAPPVSAGGAVVSAQTDEQYLIDRIGPEDPTHPDYSAPDWKEIRDDMEKNGKTRDQAIRDAAKSYRSLEAKQLAKEEAQRTKVRSSPEYQWVRDHAVMSPSEYVEKVTWSQAQERNPSLKPKDKKDFVSRVTKMNADMGDPLQSMTLRDAADALIPLSAEAVDTYGINLPEGYIKQGDLYVYQPQTPTANENQVKETGGTPPVESVPTQPAAAGKTETGTALGSGQGQETVTSPTDAEDYGGPNLTIPSKELFKKRNMESPGLPIRELAGAIERERAYIERRKIDPSITQEKLAKANDIYSKAVEEYGYDKVRDFVHAVSYPMAVTKGEYTDARAALFPAGPSGSSGNARKSATGGRNHAIAVAKAVHEGAKIPERVMQTVDREEYDAHLEYLRSKEPTPREKLLAELGTPKNPGFPDKVITPEGVAVELVQDGDKIKVSVETPQEIRNTGKATAAMRRLTDLARRDGVILDLDVVPMKDQPMSKEALTAWYAKLGFTDNGDGTMTFDPTKPVTPTPETKPVEPPMPHSVETLKTTFGVSDDVAVVTDVLAKAMGIDLGNVVYRRGGKPGSEALKQSSPVANEQAILDAVPPTRSLVADESYVYHATNRERAFDIADSGSLNVFRPDYGTDQDVWPDGSTKKRSYWSKNPGATESFAPEEGKPVILRTKITDQFKTESGTGDIYTGKPVGAEGLEILTPSGWQPLVTNPDESLYQRSPDTARFEELTSSIPANPTQADLDAWKATHPDEYQELKAMRERVLGVDTSLWESPAQAISSADTSINDKKTAATFTKVEFRPGTTNADIGGGRFDNATELLADRGVRNIIFDPFNRDRSHNRLAASRIRDGQSDTTTVNNVLNVIAEPENRDKVIRQAANAVKPDGVSYFLIYEGNNSGEGRATSKGWQENRSTKTYLPEIQKHFSNVKVRNGVIEARNPIKSGFRSKVYYRVDDTTQPTILDKTQSGAIYVTESSETAYYFSRTLPGEPKPREFFIRTDNVAKPKDLGRRSVSHLSKEEVDMLKQRGFDSAEGIIDSVEPVAKEVAVFDPTQIKSTEPLSTDATGALITPDQWGDTGNPSILYQRGSEPFYSTLSRTIEQKMPKSATPEQVMQIAASGAKAEEVKWSGLAAWMQGREKVSKDEVLEFLRNEGAVRFEEVTLGAMEKGPDPVPEFAQRMQDKYGEQWIARMTPEESAEYDAAIDATPDVTPTKFGQYVLPGGENYREVVLAMPARVPTYEEWSAENKDLQWFKSQDEEFRRKQYQLSVRDGKASRPEYTSSHFPDVPNYVAHMRTNERTDAEGKPGLFVEEFQSDRHQAGRKHGYAPDMARWVEISRKYVDGVTMGISSGILESFGATPQEVAEVKAFEAAKSDSVADAPFRTTWPLALFKRALRDAVASGKDWIGWTVGETQNDRFDLSKQVHRVLWEPREGGRGNLRVLGKESDTLLDQEMSADKVEDYIGKEAAARLFARPVEKSKYFPDTQTLDGDGLKVGGSGMKGFYDNMLPKEIGKYVKQWGAKVEKSTMPSEMDYKTWREQKRLPATRETLDQFNAEGSTAPIWRIDITPEMRDSILQTGQPLFQSGKGIKGSVEFLADGKALIRGFKSADASTGIHELTHVARRQLFDRSVPESQREEGITDDDITTVEDFCGAKNGVWDEAAEEKFARANERYLYEGKAPSQLLAPIFAKMSAWLQKIYAQVKGSPIDIEISPAMRAVLDKLYQRGDVNQAIANTPPEPLVPEIPPVEFVEPEPTPPGRASHEMSDQERANLGLPPRIPQPTVTDSDVWATAQATEDAHRAAGKPGTAGTDLMHSKLANMEFTLDTKEQALIIHEIVTRRNILSAAQRTLTSLPKNAPDLTKSEAQKAVTAAQEAYQEVLDFNDAIGSEEGRAFRLRRWIMALDYTYEGLSRRLHTAKNAHTTGNTLTPQEIATAAEYAQKLEQAQARLDALTSENAEQARLIEELTADVERAQKRDSATKSKVRKAVTDRAAEAKKRLQERGVTFLAQAQDIDAQTLTDFAAVAAEWLVDKPLTIAEFTQKLTATFGTWISDHAERIFKTAKQTYNETAASVTGKSAPSPEQVIAEIEQSDAEEPTRKEVWQLARAYVIAGLRGENVLDATHTALSELFNGLSRDRVAEIFTDYGKTSYPSQDDASKELGRIKNLERIALKITDLKAGRIPKQTGFQRDPDAVNLEVRQLEREFRRLYKEEVEAGRIPDSGADGRAKSALASAKTRMRNEIEEIDDALRRNRAMASKKSSLTLDEEATQLRADLESKRNEYNEAFPKEGLTDEKRREILIRNLDRQIAQETQMLADGILKKVKTAPVADTPEIAERRRKLAALRKERRDLYDAANPLREAKANARRAIERLTAIIEKGRIDIKEKKQINPDNELRALIETREALADEVDELRRASEEYQTRQIANALRAAEASLDRVSRKLASGDLSVPAKTVTPASRDAAVQAIRARVKELNADLDARRREEKVGPYSDEARLTRELASLAKRKAELERRIREKDVSRKAKNLPLEDARKRRAQYEIELLKAEFSQMEERLIMKNAPLTKKAQYYGIGAANLLKIVTLGFDVGVVLRQLGTTYQALVSDLSVFSKNGDARKNGSHLARLIKTGVRAFADPAVENEIYEQVKNRPGAEYDNVGSKKIYFSPPFDTFSSTKEDIPRADLMKDIPWFVWPAIAGVKWFVFGMSPPAGVALVAVGALTKPLLTRLDRAQRAMTNVSRADFVDAARRAASAEGAISLKPADYSVMNNAVMVATGRGQIKKLDPAIPVANVVLLATRFYLSRIMALSLQPLFAEGIFTPKESRAGMRARTEVAKMYARSIAGRASLYALLWAMLGRSDDEKEKKGTGLILNPFSNDFGRYRVNENLKVDFMSGINSFASITARYLGRRRYDATTEKYTALGGGFRNNVNEEASRFLSSKMNLLTKFIIDTNAGQYFGGKPVTVATAFEQASTAIITNDVVRVYEEMIGTYGKEEGAAKATAICLLMFGGMGASVRPSADEQRALKAMQKEIAKDEARRTRELNE